MARTNKTKEQMEEEIKNAFLTFDADGSGFIDRQELHKIMSGLGTKSFRAPEPSMVDELIKEADKDGDGELTVDEIKTEIKLE